MLECLSWYTSNMPEIAVHYCQPCIYTYLKLALALDYLTNCIYIMDQSVIILDHDGAFLDASSVGKNHNTFFLKDNIKKYS